MALSSISFIFGALPVFLLLFYIFKPKYRIYLLFLFSACFYCVNDPDHIVLMIALITVNYAISLTMLSESAQVRKWLLAAGVIIDLGVLFFYKYIGAFTGIGSLRFLSYQPKMMVGLSFLTFSFISYLADVYNNKITVPKNPVKFADYVLMFPKILMGPIARYSDVADSLDKMTLKPGDIGNGSKRFMEGLFKKVIIADNLAVLVNLVNSSIDYSNTSVSSFWIGSVAYSLQLFFDFSGYSDMAIGLARMMGFELKENFDHPYLCNSFSDFWKRWHISLSEWFRDYVYIPLGGSRKSIPRNIFNLLIVWLLTGIWHGTGYAFICWGLVYFLMLVIERYIIKPARLNKLSGLLWRTVTLLVVNFNWVLFSHEKLKDGLKFFAGMFGFYHNPLCSASDIRYLREFGLFLLLGIIFSCPVSDFFGNGIENKKIRKAASAVMPVIYIFLFVWALSFLLLGYHNPFMYQNF